MIGEVEDMRVADLAGEAAEGAELHVPSMLRVN